MKKSGMHVPALMFAALALSACGADANTAPPTSAAPSRVTLVARGGFQAPTDAVASPDGATFYFTARTDAGLPAVFRVASTPGSQAAAIATGAPLVAPTGLVLSCDGATLYVAGGGAAPILSMPASGGALRPVEVTNVGRVAGLAIGPDCASLYATGRTTDDQPALFKVDRGGGVAQIVFAGAPLISPDGLFVDSLSVAWVMDQIVESTTSSAVLYAVPADGHTASVVVRDIRTVGLRGGVSLTSSGGTAVLGTLAASGGAQLTTIELATGHRTDVPAPQMIGPAGLRTARGAAVIAVADAGGNSIFRAE